MLVSSPDQFPPSFAAAFSSGELTAVMALYCSDAVLVSPTGSELRGSEPIAKYLQSHLARNLTMRICMKNIVVLFDIALLNNEFEVLDGQTILFRGNSTELLRRETDGGWRLLIDKPLSSATIA